MSFSYDYFDKAMRWRYKAEIIQTLVAPELVGIKIESAPGDRVLIDTAVVLMGTVGAGRNVFGDLRDVSNDITIDQFMTNTAVTSGQHLRLLKASQSNANTTTANVVGRVNDYVIVSGDDFVRVGAIDLAQNEAIKIVISGWIEHDKPTVSALGANQTTTEVYNKTV